MRKYGANDTPAAVAAVEAYREAAVAAPEAGPDEFAVAAPRMCRGARAAAKKNIIIIIANIASITNDIIN